MRGEFVSFWGSRLSWLLLIIAVIGDFVVAYILAVFYSGYSHQRQVMSILGSKKSPVGLIYNIWLVALGILICISAMNFYYKYTEVSKNYASLGLIILLIFGLGAGILAGVFSVDDEKTIETIASKVHGIGAGIGFMALTFIPLIVGLIMFKQGDSMIIGIVSILCFVISIVLFVLFIMSEREIYQNSIIGLGGLWQRLLLGSMYLPLLLISIKNIIEYKV